MLDINIGDRVEADGRIWYCPLSDIIKRID